MKAIRTYLIISFGIMVPVCAIVMLLNQFGFPIYNTTFGFAAVALGGVSTAVAGGVAVKRSGKISSYRKILRDFFAFNQPLRYYIVVALVWQAKSQSQRRTIMSVDTLTVTSTVFSANGYIPVKYTGYGLDISPPLTMSGIFPAAKSLVIIMDDIDHPIPSYNHWIIWNIPNMSTIPENIPHGDRIVELGGAVQGRGYGKNRYRGPKPPFNWSHRYQYSVYALDAMLDLPSGARKKDLLKAMQGNVLQEGSITGIYKNRKE